MEKPGRCHKRGLSKWWDGSGGDQDPCIYIGGLLCHQKGWSGKNGSAVGGYCTATQPPLVLALKREVMGRPTQLSATQASETGTYTQQNG